MHSTDASNCTCRLRSVTSYSRAIATSTIAWLANPRYGVIGRRFAHTPKTPGNATAPVFRVPIRVTHQLARLCIDRSDQPFVPGHSATSSSFDAAC